MSRIGKLPIKIVDSVKVDIKDNVISVEGKRGKLSQEINSSIQVKIENSNIIIERSFDDKQTRAFHGLYRSLIFNMVKGVSDGFSKSLIISGIGYRVEQQGKSLFFNLGYSTQFEYVIPEGINIQLDGNTKISVEGIDKCRVGQVAAEIRSLKVPEPYKGKGIKYDNEVSRRKIGKSGVKK
ncbi:50S ribosomal protein L6 [Borrelia anserina]|uniref:Large ribosomal subunit protein uL6 n=2 Tax=Borrelia anserina TaxID=143 RepID=W5SPC7_BORAN|nr:50S ribosomal protein L6 [Borrelia anserina]AHH08473.1 LSU ribosomal protein L6P [Borrelia anserina BA2]AHX39222.1 ribosomal protein [Borrelia anserina Es]APR64945.1 50S ribosomal protein L6 [Borrelia anserina Es]UPA06867.1 50S ribosomal protein L6 [Borrelia anserina]